MIDVIKSNLLNTESLESKLQSPSLTIVESALDDHEFQLEHLPGSVFLPIQGGLLNLDFSLKNAADIGQLLNHHGISADNEIVVLSENPAISAWLYWLFKSLGAVDVYILDGGRGKWIAESKPTTASPSITNSRESSISWKEDFSATCLSKKTDVLRRLADDSCTILDVRSELEFSGEWFTEAPPSAEQRTGHIPGAIHMPFELTLNADGTFKSAEELSNIFADIGKERDIICYCAAGFRSALMWLVLKEILRYPNVTNYAGSWIEWSADPTLPINKHNP